MPCPTQNRLLGCSSEQLLKKSKLKIDVLGYRLTVLRPLGHLNKQYSYGSNHHFHTGTDMQIDTHIILLIKLHGNIEAQIKFTISASDWNFSQVMKGELLN